MSTFFFAQRWRCETTGELHFWSTTQFECSVSRTQRLFATSTNRRILSTSTQSTWWSMANVQCWSADDRIRFVVYDKYGRKFSSKKYVNLYLPGFSDHKPMGLVIRIGTFRLCRLTPNRSPWAYTWKMQPV